MTIICVSEEKIFDEGFVVKLDSLLAQTGALYDALFQIQKYTLILFSLSPMPQCQIVALSCLATT